MNEERGYYRDRNSSVIYNPDNSDYEISIESTKGFGIELSLDQKIMEEFSRQNILKVSEKLAAMHLSDGLSRTDIARVYT